MEGKKRSTVDIAIVVLAVILAVSVLFLGVRMIQAFVLDAEPTLVTIPDNIIIDDDLQASNGVTDNTGTGTVAGDSGQTQDTTGGSIVTNTTTGSAGTAAASRAKAATISLYNRQPEENVKFEAVNMFPGDTVTQYYRVSTTFSNSVTVRFGVKVRDGYEKLGEELQLRVRLLNTGATIYEGPINNLVGSADHVLVSATGEKTEELYYEIHAYLKTDVTNDYQSKILLADFRWWVEETGNLGESPKTGDNSTLIPVLACFSAVLFILLLALLRSRRPEKGTKQSRKLHGKLTKGIATVVGLSLCLGISTYALVYNEVTINDNLFETGKVSINLNDGKPVIAEDEFLLEPGMTVKKDFFLENNSTCDVYYKLYFSNVDGDLADVLEVTIKDGDRTLYSGIMSDMSRANAGAADDLLREGETRTMTIFFHFPKERGNDVMNLTATFDLSADAVQAVHNTFKEFE